MGTDKNAQNTPAIDAAQVAACWELLWDKCAHDSLKTYRSNIKTLAYLHVYQNTSDIMTKQLAQATAILPLWYSKPTQVSTAATIPNTTRISNNLAL